jgi:hypothetical protein
MTLAAIDRLVQYHLLILDDIVYVSKDQAETSVLFELIGSRYVMIVDDVAVLTAPLRRPTTGLSASSAPRSS